MTSGGLIRARAKLCRRGITLLEVLISMFVALVGLSGLAALFWLGGIEMSEGVKLRPGGRRRPVCPAVAENLRHVATRPGL